MLKTTIQIQFGVHQTNRNPRRTTLKKHTNQPMKTCWNCWSFPSYQANNDREDLSGTNTRQCCDAQKYHHHSITSAWIDSCPSMKNTLWYEQIKDTRMKKSTTINYNQLQSTTINYKTRVSGGYCKSSWVEGIANRDELMFLLAPTLPVSTQTGASKFAAKSAGLFIYIYIYIHNMYIYICIYIYIHSI